jgi:hypothetical protein
MVRVYNIDDRIGGFNSSDKLRNLYAELRKHVFTKKHLHKSPESLITLSFPNYRDGNYGWELHDRPVFSMIEYFGSWTGYAHEIRFAGDGPPGIEGQNLKHLRISLYNEPQPKTITKIEELIAKANAKKLEVVA